MQWSPGDKIFCKSEKTKDKRIKARTLQNTLRHEYQICLFQYHSKIFLHRKNRLTPCTSLFCSVSRHNCVLKFVVLEGL